ncbi:hypothetical protein [Lysinibacillus fusiformis]|uniref:hypothetical protein n=1 Tax=Lysinibacillus fusiformis TaxID=28031 RepID=UPI00380F0759
MSGSVRDLFVGINFRDEASRALQQIDQVMDNIEDGAIGLGRGLARTERNFSQFGLSGRTASRMVQEGLDHAETEANQLNSEVRRISGTLDGFKSTMRGLVGVVAGAFAVDKIKEFGLSAIEAAAGFQAMDAQFDQVFTGMQSKADDNLNKIAKQTGMLPERLKGSFTQIAAFAKTTGADTSDALSLTERATLAAADSAAFYDRSIEQVIENMQSFLKGNFENDAALGISATETTRNAKANALYGKSFIKLSESQKQLTLMAMVEDGNKLSGALGQASREADAYENQLGNLKQSWTNLKGKIGGPLLQPFVDGMASVSQWIENIDTDKLVNKIDSVINFAGTAKNTLVSLWNDSGDISELWQKFGLPKETSDNIASFADTMRTTLVTGVDVGKEAFDGFKTAVSWVIENKDIVIAATAGIAGGFAVMKTISFVKTALDLFKASTIASTFATHGFNAALRANPIGMVVTGISLLIAAGVYLYQNWDTVKTKAIALWQVIDNNPILSFLAGPIKGLISAGITIYKNWDTITSNFNNFKNAITNFKLPKWVSSIGSTIGKAAGAVGNFISGSHATGLESVPYDGYVAELHKGEAVLTANQSNMLRRAGILSQGSSGTPELSLANSSGSDVAVFNTDKSNTPSNNGGHQFIFHITGDNPQDIAQKVREVISDMLDAEMQTT